MNISEKIDTIDANNLNISFALNSKQICKKCELLNYYMVFIV